MIPKTAIEHFKQERSRHTEPYRPFYDEAIFAIEQMNRLITAYDEGALSGDIMALVRDIYKKAKGE